MTTIRSARYESFTEGLAPYWTQTVLGTGSLSLQDAALRMEIQSLHKGHYADAQIDDYGKLARSAFPWRPPLRMEVRARSSLPAATQTSTISTPDILRGTAGFGFWNYPFSVRGDLLMLPEAIWFFYASPPSNMALVPDIPGWGWKAQVVHTMRPGAFLSLLPTALTAGWGLLTQQTQSAARWVQRLSGAHEALLTTPLEEWHTYTLEWKSSCADFWVDGHHVLHAPQPPTRPLGFVAWLDNQYAIATPQGHFRFGTVMSETEWFEIAALSIVPLI
ncbi:hypothetical protein [Tengunoibacter tsumagoiensis]|uniref:GH16 domain-containing protein n=1 Tax=Tengunoibacter tsumagoiensis TaxID=2014871 RepID=A0A401ZZR2_9CHLR|nr:hypothetical protein [Tengunoibacter tsumagoiensis]GCE12358.1 hypothetical protein KTT_22170 [Tengunoibacter tsumagoiensis]